MAAPLLKYIPFIYGVLKDVAPWVYKVFMTWRLRKQTAKTARLLADEIHHKEIIANIKAKRK